MIVFAWFVLVSLIALAGFTFIGVTVFYWYKQSREAKKPTV